MGCRQAETKTMDHIMSMNTGSKLSMMGEGSLADLHPAAAGAVGA